MLKPGFNARPGLAIALIAAGFAIQTGCGTNPVDPRPGADSGKPATASGPKSSDLTSTPARQIPAKPVLDPYALEDGGLGIVQQYTGTIHDPKSLTDIRDAVAARGKIGLAVLKADLSQIRITPDTPIDQLISAGRLHRSIGLVYLHEGRFKESDAAFAEALKIGERTGMTPKVKADLTLMRGVVALRRGEVENCIECVGASSCIYPISPAAVHVNPGGSRDAIRYFTEYLDVNPGDVRVMWILNLAAMTLGEYPAKVPPAYLVPIDSFRSAGDEKTFENIAPKCGLTARGPNSAGGSVFDDFTGDGLPDLFTTSLDVDRGASLFVNRGDGTFDDHSHSAGLDDQVYALNVTRADYDNDGDLDVLLLRGAWEKPMRPSLLRNKGDGTFEDVTVAAGMAEPISSESASWGDYNNDGLLDVFVCGEYLPPSGAGSPIRPDPRNRCRLYRNKGDGTFEDMASKAGVVVEQCAKGSAWGDYDGDGRLDLYVSNMSGPSRLYRNEGEGRFRNVAPELGVTGAEGSFACWFWDYDNDGKLDIFVNDRGVPLSEAVAIAMKLPGTFTNRPRLYRNLGKEGFRDVTKEVGLDQARPPMGCNFGDINEDGFLDLYLGTGAMDFTYLVPNQMFKSVGGKKFEDVTMATGTGHLQKGHGVSFADFDGDGDLDLFVESGGAVPGDRSYNQLFRNPGHGRHWLDVKLVGTKTNRSAIGAEITATYQTSDGASHTICRTIGNNSSFGGNTLVEHLGLADANRVAELKVHWPTSGATQSFRDLSSDRTIEITEGSDSVKLLERPKSSPAAK